MNTKASGTRMETINMIRIRQNTRIGGYSTWRVYIPDILRDRYEFPAYYVTISWENAIEYADRVSKLLCL